VPIAKEGLREIALATVVLALLAVLGIWLWWPAAIPIVVLWLWVLSFFRDPHRKRDFAPAELCSPADGTIMDITELAEYPPIHEPAVRVGMFLSLFNVHINRMPCAGKVLSVSHKPGHFLDARDPRAGEQNESTTLVLDPDCGLPGPVVVRQVAGRVARRIVCHAESGQHWPIGSRYGLIKFGSRTELVIPRRAGTEICVKVGDKVSGGITVLARQTTTSRNAAEALLRPEARITAGAKR